MPSALALTENWIFGTLTFCLYEMNVISFQWLILADCGDEYDV